MLRIIAILAGILLWAPGLGIPIAGRHMLSPYEIMILLILPAILVSSLDWRRGAFALVAVGIATLSFLNSIDRGISQLYYAYYLAIIIPQMLLFLQIFAEEAAAGAFFRSFVRTGICLAPLAVLQLVSPIEITLNNNTNYSLARGLHRAWLFTPEASILAGLYVIAICLVLYNRVRRVDPDLPHGAPALIALFVGIGSTISTSVVLLLPPLVLVTWLLAGARVRRIAIAILLCLPLFLFFLFFVYVGRIETGGAAGSVGLRLVSIIAGGRLVLSHWLTGVGIGMNREALAAIELLSLKWGGEISAKPGFDSFQLSLVAEMGILPGLLSLAAFVLCLRVLWRHRLAPAIGSELIAIFAIIAWCVALTTGGYRGLAHFWLYFPAAYAFFLPDGSARILWLASLVRDRFRPPALLGHPQ